MAVLTKSKQVEKYLRNAIMSGRWSSGSTLPPERDLLAEFGISRATLRDALSSLSNDGLIVRKQGSGTYVGDVEERGVVAVTGSAHNLSSPLGYWYRDLVQKAQERVASAGHKSALWIGDGSSLDTFVESTSLFQKSNIRQTLAVLNTVYFEGLDARFAAEGVTSVNISLVAPAGKYSVVLDYAQMTEQAVRTLKSHGYEDFMLFCEPTRKFSRDRVVFQLETELARLQRWAVDFNEDRMFTVDTTDGFNSVYDGFKEMWSRPNRPRAIFFYDDSFFDIASRAILELGIRVPEELAILTHANSYRQFHFPIPITRVGFSSDHVVDAAWSMCRKLISGEPMDAPVEFIPAFVEDGESL